MFMRMFLCFCIVVGVGTKIDPTLCRADRLVGQVLGAVGALPDIYTELEISYFLLRRLLGVRTEGDKKGAKVWEEGWYMGVKGREMMGCVEDEGVEEESGGMIGG